MTTLKSGHQLEPGEYEDNWYRGHTGVYVCSKADNTKRHIGDEIDIAWTHMFMDGKVSFQAAYGHLFAGAISRRTWAPASRSRLGLCPALDELLEELKTQSVSESLRARGILRRALTSC